MIVYKFGGASVKNADSVRQLLTIVKQMPRPGIVVISAMGKTTNKLERLVAAAKQSKNKFPEILAEIREDHLQMVANLELQDDVVLEDTLSAIFEELDFLCGKSEDVAYDFLYDQVVSKGEWFSTIIVHHYLIKESFENVWLDARQLIRTDANYMMATVDQKRSAKACQKIFKDADGVFITQGFIGEAPDGTATTLGREGSDYSAALLAGFTNAGEVVLWKDVEGVFSADPALFQNPVKINEMSFREVVRLTYYGAKIIHPKTLKPLRENNIPLFVRGFHNPDVPGTKICGKPSDKLLLPLTVVKAEQVLITLSNPDESYVSESHISQIFDLLNSFKVKVNMMQHAAVSFSVCTDRPRVRQVEDLIENLSNQFKVLYNENLELITIRNYTEKDIRQVVGQRKVIVEQRSRQVVQYVVA